MTTIANYAFAYGETEEQPQYNIVNVNIPNSVVSIGKYAFANQKLKSIKLPNQLVSIGEGAFLNCTNPNSGKFNTVIPSTVTTIGAKAFSGVSKMAVVEMRNTAITALPDQVFAGCVELRDIRLPNGLLTIGANALSGTSALTSLIIPNGVTSIDANAFSASSLTSIYYSGTAEGSPWGASAATVYENNTI